MAIALCTTIAAADNWVEVAEFGQVHQDWFAQFVDLPSGVASHDTFARVFRLPAHTPAHVLAHSMRAHWSVESNLHWSLDMAMHEDAAQTCKNYAAQNRSLIPRRALQLLKSDKSARIGVQARRKRAGWDLKYLERLIYQTGN